MYIVGNNKIDLKRFHQKKKTLIIPIFETVKICCYDIYGNNHFEDQKKSKNTCIFLDRLKNSV